MTEPFSKSRQQAEVAFAKTQSAFVARNRTAAETNPDAQARADKTLRLKTARLEKVSGDLANSAGEHGSTHGSDTEPGEAAGPHLQRQF